LDEILNNSLHSEKQVAHNDTHSFSKFAV